MTCATTAEAIATVAAAGTDVCAAEEEEHGSAVDIGNSSNDRPPHPPPLALDEPPPVIPSSEEVTISMMLDESDRDLIAARLAVLEASAEDINYIISSQTATMVPHTRRCWVKTSCNK